MTYNTRSVLLTVLMVTLRIEAAYRGTDCPSPCFCVNFMGQQGTYCNSTGITAIPKNIPLNTQLLDLSRNSITFITSQQLQNLVNLETLSIYGMGLTDKNVDLTTLKLLKLQDIYIGGNGYTSVPQTLPDYIQDINLGDSIIPVLRADALKPYPNLKKLDLEYSGLLTIEPGAFDYSTKLTELRISFNNLTDESFPPNIFVNNTVLDSVSMRFNMLRHVLPGLPVSLTYLDYVGNTISTIQAYAFNCTPNLASMELWQGQVMYSIYIVVLSIMKPWFYYKIQINMSSIVFRLNQSGLLVCLGVFSYRYEHSHRTNMTSNR